MNGRSLSGRLSGRLLLGGMPAVLAAALASVTPLLGLLFLDAELYQIWALASVLFTVFLVFDFGAPTLATKLASERALDRRSFWSLVLVSIAAPLALGLLAAVLWPSYAGATGISTEPRSLFLPTLSLVILGSCLRSMGSIYAASALGANRFTARSVTLISGAIVQIIATLIALELGASVPALGIGLTAGGVAQCLIGHAYERKHLAEHVLRRADVGALIWRFIRARSTTAAIGLTVTQLDRWALGFVADPAFISVYDLAARVGTMPKIALIAASSGTVTEVARSEERAHVENLYSRIFRLTAALSVLGGLGAIAVTAVVAALPAVGLPVELAVLIALPVCLGHAIHTWTLPSTNTLSALGSPGFELFYIVPMGILVVTSYALAVSFESEALFVLGWAVAVVLTSVTFVAATPKLIRRTWRNRLAARA